MDETQVIKDILMGNAKRYAEIVTAYQQIVANLCYKFAGNKLDIEEVTQQVFVELYMSLPRFQFKSKLSTYIYRITVNVVCKELRHISHTTLIDTNDRDMEGKYITDNGAEKEMMHNEQIVLLRNALDHLHHEQRTALVLYTFDELSYKDIADVMQCSVAKVETLIFRARKILKKEMNTKYCQ